MSAVAPGDSTVVFMRKKVRRLTASSGESALTTQDLDQYLNNVILNDFPYAIKIDQMRSIYTFFTRPYIDRYPLDVNFNQGIRAPIYIEGILGSLFKDRGQFYNLWPRFPTKFQQGGTTLTGTITGIAQPTNPTQITSVAHNLTTGAVINISGVGGMTQLNGNIYTITVINPNLFSLIGVDNTAFGSYTSGGTWSTISQSFSFVIPAPFLSKEVVIGGIDSFGNAISINDDGNGTLQLITVNAVVTTPPYTDVYSAVFPTGNAPSAGYVGKPIPGMHNQNTLSPGQNKFVNIGTVNYVTGRIDFLLPSGISLAAGTLFTVWVSQYQPGRPYNLLFWNNELTIRPIPKLIHKVEVETYLTPIQFMLSTDVPILNQWAQYIAYLAAMEILRDRNDFDGVEGLREGMMRQEALVLERQGIEEIGTPNYQFFNSTQSNYINGGWGQGGYL
jgi:hypothetical protein